MVNQIVAHVDKFRKKTTQLANHLMDSGFSKGAQGCSKSGHQLFLLHKKINICIFFAGISTYLTENFSLQKYFFFIRHDFFFFFLFLKKREN